MFVKNWNHGINNEDIELDGGFIGKNLIAELKRNIQLSLNMIKRQNLLESNTNKRILSFIYGVNRPKETTEFMEGNFGFTSSYAKEI